MAGICRRLRALRDDQRGFTLMELLIAATMGLVVIGGGVMMFTSVVRSEPRTADRSAAIEQGRVTMERMTRELRQGATVTTGGATQLSLLTWVDSASCGGNAATTSIQCQVTYSCSGGTCTRVEAAPGVQSGTPVTVVSGLTPGTVFTYSSCSGAPTVTEFVGIRLVFSAENGEDALTLSDGVDLRNNASCQT
jgi:prepilin-type N-terminal cleavage/methylation domain-containing protein